MKVLDVFSGFFSRLSTRDQAMLKPDKVIMFLRAMDVRDRKDLGVLLEDTTTESGLTNTWENVVMPFGSGSLHELGGNR